MKRLLFFLLLYVSYALGAQEARNEVKVISFNIRNSSEMSERQDGSYYWTYRKDAVAKMLVAERPDAIGLQEALIDQIAFLDSALVDYQRVGVGRDDGATEGEWMAIYFRRDRFDLVKSATYWLSETPDKPSRGWDAACRRTVTVVQLRDRISGKDWVYMNTHLDHVGKTARAESTKQLRKLADEWDAVPIVIGGDMNSTLEDTIFQTLTEVRLLSARDLAPISDNKLTYNAYEKGKAQQIDHFFVRKLRPLAFRTLDGNYGVPYVSDHYPVMMSFVF
ncbi:MAG: endonuclease/exonuclease/phosphatase family protein [Bacteroidales bacterium]|nr:endonuclease/exonuclease/phosphatase family protein [Candidatus Colimorpha pelethequi]